MLLNDHVRALTFDLPGEETAPRIVLAVKRECARLPVTTGVSDLGEDDKALLFDPATRLFDLGLGRKEGRFCVRVANGSAREALQDAIGLPILQMLPRIGATLLCESPTRIIESALGRIEVQGRIPTSPGHALDGPHTHLIPDLLATGRALPVGMDLPRAYPPGAIFYPKHKTHLPDRLVERASHVADKKRSVDRLDRYDDAS